MFFEKCSYDRKQVLGKALLFFFQAGCVQKVGRARADVFIGHTIEILQHFGLIITSVSTEQASHSTVHTNGGLALLPYGLEAGAEKKTQRFY